MKTTLQELIKETNNIEVAEKLFNEQWKMKKPLYGTYKIQWNIFHNPQKLLTNKK